MKDNNKKKVVLVVDDSLVVLQRMIPMLQGIPNVEFVIHAGTYKEAIDVLDELKPDYILLDIHLPDQSGIGRDRTILSRPLGWMRNRDCRLRPPRLRILVPMNLRCPPAEVRSIDGRG